MKAIIQRVNHATLTADGVLHSNIGYGLVVMLGVMENDTPQMAQLLAQKIAQMRIFCDDEGKMNISAEQLNADILVISNFTLSADCKKRRPYFGLSARPEHAQPLYEQFIEHLQGFDVTVKSGVFGADMQIDTQLNGPVTIPIDSNDFIGQ